jgi:hypothetical protein
MTRSRSAAALAAALSLLGACSREAPPNQPRITLGDGRAPAFVVVDGLNDAALRELSGRSADSGAFADVVRVDVVTDAAAAALPPMAGTFAVAGRRLRFTPSFPFESGRRYKVSVDARTLPGGGAAPVTFEFAVVAEPPAAASTRVIGMSPRARVLPANLLRLYLHFSGPMARDGAAGHVRLLDAEGRTIEDVFLPLDADLWNDDRTRYTLLLDPGRVKTGIAPNDALGRALLPGRRYALLVDASWRDAAGRPLAEPFRREFTAGPPIDTALDPTGWRLAAPRAGTRAALEVTAPHLLDEALARRALGIMSATGAVVGEPSLDETGTRWRFIPDRPWTPGAHQIVILGILEDPAGNRIGRPFELTPSDTSREVERLALPFIIAP